MKPGTIFISHRAEYGSLVRELKKSIETTSRGRIEAIISRRPARGRKVAISYQVPSGGRRKPFSRLRRTLRRLVLVFL